MFPKDGETGSTLAKQKFSKYCKIINDMPSGDVEKFCKAIMGESHVACLKQSSLHCKTIKSFVEMLETKLGKNLENLY